MILVTYLDSLLNRASSLFKDRLETLTRGLRLVGNRAFGQVACSICRYLARDEDVRASLDGL